jgi:hypothetical protein
VYIDSWLVALNSITPVTFEGLKDAFRERGQSQYIDHLKMITQPVKRGHWTIAINWLVAINPVPQIWCFWEGKYTVRDAVVLQDYSQRIDRQTNKEAYPMTLL